MTLSFLLIYISDWFARGQPFLGDWAPENTSEFVSLRMQLASEGKYQEVQNTPQDIVLYHSMQKVIQECTITSVLLIYARSDRGYLGK